VHRGILEENSQRRRRRRWQSSRGTHGVHTGYTRGCKTGVHTGVHTSVHTGVFWISTGCGHDAVIKITERGNGIRKCVVSVPRFVCGADDALKLFFAVGTYALIKMPDLLLVKV
jgi:hypothetical protein